MSKLFNKYAFDDTKIEKLVGKEALDSLKKARTGNSPLDREVTEKIAKAMEKWAVENGATYYSHWFHPIGGTTAEKLTPISVSSPYSKQCFNAKCLLKGESDASSFPSGGLRSTFEAAGLSRWDYSSPAFLKQSGDTMVLHIPTIFYAPHGEALDKKTPLLRSLNVMQSEVMALLKLLGEKPAEVINYVGVEQEFFLIDKALYETREDLSILGRTVFGSENKNLQFNSRHYSASFSERVAYYMTELGRELELLGITPCAIHQESSPNQFEIALSYAPSNIIMDQNQILMDLMKTIAERHNLVVLLDEKPFNGVNGSGKHTNWSISNGKDNLLTPGKKGEHTLRFLLLLSMFVRATDKYGPLILSSVASRSNEFRLGKLEAPPMVLSLFLGEKLTSIFELPLEELKDIVISKEMRDSDRNRTSPIAFTGNKFEFRAVGASQSIGSPVTFLNAAFTESVREARLRLEKAKDKKEECYRIIKDFWNEHKRVVFNGNCYSEDWDKEREKRHLIKENDTKSSILRITDKENIELLNSLDILSESEVISRKNVYIENYEKTVILEATIAKEMARKYIIPAALKDLTLLKASGIDNSFVGEFASLLDEVMTLTDKLDNTLKAKDEELIKNELNKLREKADLLYSSIAQENRSISDYEDLLLPL